MRAFYGLLLPFPARERTVQPILQLCSSVYGIYSTLIYKNPYLEFEIKSLLQYLTRVEDITWLKRERSHFKSFEFRALSFLPAMHMPHIACYASKLVGGLRLPNEG